MKPTPPHLTVTPFARIPLIPTRPHQLQLPHFDPTIPTLSETLPFVARHRFFDFSGVDTMPLEEYNGLSQNAEVCPPKVMGEGMDALFLIGEL